jgi:type 1 glutamine amidotransferase
MRWVRTAGVLLIASTCLAAADEIPPHRARQIHDAAPAKAAAAPKKPRRVLIWVTPAHLMGEDPHKGYCIPYGTAAMRTLGTKTGAFEPVVGDDLASFLPENLARFDAVVLNNSSGPWATPTEADIARPEFRKLGDTAASVERALRDNFLAWVRGGRGVVAVHFAIGANRQWPEFREMLGATFTGHPWNEEVGVRVEEPGHPLAAAFAGADFRIADEIYQFGPPYQRKDLRVLLSLDPARTNMGVKWIERKDGDFALAWVKKYGAGRVFYTSFGHRTEIYWDPRILRLYLDAIQFAAGDLDAPAEPRGPQPPAVATPPVSPDGFARIFDGKTLAGWTGDDKLWSVQDGAITGETTERTKLKVNEFLTWKDEVEDFELRLKFKLEGGNSGIYYRSRKLKPGDTIADPLIGTQADFDSTGRWTGVIMEYGLRDVLAERGQKVRVDAGGKKEVVGKLGDPAELLKSVKPGEWNDYHMRAKGGSVILTINGVRMCELDDQDPKRLTRGWLGLQVHVGKPMRVQFKDVELKRL